MTLRWVKDVETKQYHLLRHNKKQEAVCVRTEGRRAWFATECGKVVEGVTFRDGYPPGADCVPCLQLATQAGGSDSTTARVPPV